MSRRLQYVNLLGVLVLGTLCLLQWRHDRQLNLQVIQLEKSRLELQERTRESEEKLRAASEDADYFHSQISKSADALHDTGQKLNKSQTEADLLTLERDQLKSAITNWAAAVEVRDERNRKLAADLNTSIEKFNRLATNHNALVKEFNDLNAKLAAQQQGKSETGK